MNRFKQSAANFPPVGGQLRALHRPGHTILLAPNTPPVAAGAARVYVPFECKDMGLHMSDDEEPVPDGALFDVHEGNLNEDLPTVDGDLDDSPEGWWSFQLGASIEKVLMLEAELDGDGGILSRRLFLTDTPDSFVTAMGDPETGNPPSHAWRRMARLVTDSEFHLTIVQYKRGDQTVSIIVSDFTCETKTRNVVWEKSAA